MEPITGENLLLVSVFILMLAYGISSHSLMGKIMRRTAVCIISLMLALVLVLSLMLRLSVI
jgi:hypothetical protein